MNLTRLGTFAILTALASTAPCAATITATIHSVYGSRVVINPVTNKIYALRDSTNGGTGFTVVDGATNASTFIETNKRAVQAAVNPVTNKIYIANQDPNPSPGNNLTIVDGATNAVTGVTLGVNPCGVAVNPVTNKIYVASKGSGQLWMIDGATNATSSVAVGVNPCAVAVNPSTNKVYVANNGTNNITSDSSLTVVDGATLSVLATLPTGHQPAGVAVNPATNRIYVTSDHEGTSVIDGAADTVIASGIAPSTASGAVIANPANNKIYVANLGFPGTVGFHGDVTLIDGATNAATSITAGSNPFQLELDTATNTVYVMPGGSNSGGIVTIDGDTNVAAGSTGPIWPAGIAINPVTNRLYVTQLVSDPMYVIDENTYATTTIASVSGALTVVNPVTGNVYAQAGNGTAVIDSATDTVTMLTNPCPAAVNAATNRLYAPFGPGTIRVTDGATNAFVADINLGGGNYPVVAVNEVTNRIYATQGISSLPSGGNVLKVIDGVTNTVIATVTIGDGAISMDIDRATNKIYIANILNGTVSVVDGATNAVTTIQNGGRPEARLAVNPATNKIYVANNTLGSVSVIDGATGALAVVPAGPGPDTIVVNPVTNRIYVTNNAPPGGVTVLDGATNTIVATVPPAAGSNGNCGIGLDSVRDKVYIGNCGNGLVTVVDGATLTTTTVSTATQNPRSIVVNPVNGKVYASSGGTDLVGVTVITPARASLTNHGVTLAGGSLSSSDAPALTFNVCCAYAPNDPATLATYFRVGDTNGTFTAASGSGTTFTSPPAPLQPGVNFVKAWTLDATHYGSASSLIGAPAVIPLVSIAPVFTTPASLPGTLVGATYSQSVTAVGGAGSLTYTLAGGTLPPGLSIAPDGTIAGTATTAGFYTFTVAASDGSSGSASRLFGINVLASDPPREIGISTRMQVLSGQDVVIGGFAIGGAGAHKTVVIRARGPSLAAAGVANPMANPVIQLFGSGSTPIATNDDWQSSPNADLIEASGFAPPYASESAIMVTLDSGLYTAVVTGAGGSTGVGIVEIFELDNSDVPLVAISTRGPVQTGDNVMIGGFIIGGTAPQTVVVRARGPSLAAGGVSSPLQDPTLTLVGSGISITNDNWGSAPNAAQIQASGFAPSDPRESAILITLQPGAYTAIVSGVGGTTGVGIVEVFAQ
jgi:YVTN family beta-propeller protein